LRESIIDPERYFTLACKAAVEDETADVIVSDCSEFYKYIEVP
jgi:hypothetical protein